MYTTYDFYLTDYGGDLGEFEFNKAAFKVEAFLDEVTFGRLAKYQETEQHELQFAVCEMVDALVTEVTGRKGGKEVSSVSNDGYSETYVTSNKTSIEAARGEMFDIAALYLPHELFEQSIY